MKKFLLIVMLVVLVLSVAGCATEADLASQNMSKAADEFEVPRRIIFYNGITDTYMLTIEGLCSLGNYDDADELTVTCKVEDGMYVKHFLGLSDNVTFFVEQLDPVPVSAYRYKTVFRPSVVIPDIDVELGW